jgi:hypothetical protein
MIILNVNKEKLITEIMKNAKLDGEEITRAEAERLAKIIFNIKITEENKK